MGQNELLLIALFAVPVAAVMLLRANAAFVFLSMCAGYTVGQVLGPDLRAFADMLMPGIGAQTMKLCLIVVPALLTVLFYTRSVKGSRLLINTIPAVAVGFLAVALIVPLLSTSLSQAFMATSLWKQFAQLESLLIGASGVACLLLLWLQRPMRAKEPADKKK